MPRKKKPFIDKKNAVTFHLVHRSQRDPLQADETAPKHVLFDANKACSSKSSHEKRKEEERSYGVFFDDDYDYMQHLCDSNEIHQVEPIESSVKSRPTEDSEESSKLQLPSTVFASKSEADVGLLNKAVPLRGPQLDWDPDIVAALDDDFDHDDPDNKLEDNFMLQAMNEVVNQEKDEEQSSGEESDIGSDFGSFDDDNSFSDEETKSRFTNYSMSSSVIRRNEGLSLLDDRFEKIYEEYDDEEIGSLEQEDITGCVTQNSDLLNDALHTFEKEMKEINLKDVVKKYEGEYSDSGSSSEEDMITVAVEQKPKEKWDCESILSTYSTLYNHPKTIEEPKKIKPIRLKKVGGDEMPAEVLSRRGLTKKELQQLDMEQDNGRAEYVPTFRPKDETTEERKNRKTVVKEERKARREEKKFTKLAFKSEKQKQERELINATISKQGVRIV